MRGIRIYAVLDHLETHGSKGTQTCAYGILVFGIDGAISTQGTLRDERAVEAYLGLFGFPTQSASN